jgi:hypothetical protein
VSTAQCLVNHDKFNYDNYQFGLSCAHSFPSLRLGLSLVTELSVHHWRCLFAAPSWHSVCAKHSVASHINAKINYKFPIWSQQRFAFTLSEQGGKLWNSSTFSVWCCCCILSGNDNRLKKNKMKGQDKKRVTQHNPAPHIVSTSVFYGLLFFLWTRLCIVGSAEKISYIEHKLYIIKQYYLQIFN